MQAAHDIPGVEMSHVGELCSFDAFLSKYELTDPALLQLPAMRKLLTTLNAIAKSGKHWEEPVHAA